MLSRGRFTGGWFGVGLVLTMAAPALAEQVERDDAVVLGHVDDSAEGCRSLGASGHAVHFAAPEEARYVEAVRIFCARYGPPEAPARSYHVYLLDELGLPIVDLPFAYETIEPGGPDDLRWHACETPAIEVPGSFTVALAFEPDQANGVYVGYDESGGGTHSSSGLPEDGFEPVQQPWDWMVRVVLVPTPSEGREVRRLADRELPAEAAMPEGCSELSWDDGESDKMQSYGGSGPRIRFDLNELLSEEQLAEDLAVYGLRVYGSRYGGGFDPQTTMVRISFLDAGQNPYDTRQVPYAAFTHDAQWVAVRFAEPVPLQSQADGILDLCLDPEAHQTKGIYFHYNEEPPVSHSSRGRPDRGFKDTPDREWMIRAWVGPHP